MESHAGRDGKLSAQLNPNALITFLSSAAFSLLILFSFSFPTFLFSPSASCSLFSFFICPQLLFLASFSLLFYFLLPSHLFISSLLSFTFIAIFFVLLCTYCNFFSLDLSAEMDCGSHGDKMCY